MVVRSIPYGPLIFLESTVPVDWSRRERWIEQHEIGDPVDRRLLLDQAVPYFDDHLDGFERQVGDPEESGPVIEG